MPNGLKAPSLYHTYTHTHRSYTMMKSVKSSNVAWAARCIGDVAFTITRVPQGDREYLSVYFPDRDSYKRTRKLYRPEQAVELQKAIVESVKSHDFPFTDKHGNSQWLAYTPHCDVEF